MTSSIPHTFDDERLLERALRHASSGTDHNERLEFLGDAVLDLIVAEELFRNHPDLDEGHLTELKAWVVSRATLAHAARDLGLGDRAVLGPGLQRRALSRSVLANLYEAVLGAVYLDAGQDVARRFVLDTLAEPLARVDARDAGPNPKQSLQQLAQARTGVPPHYELVEERGLAHARAFLVRARIGGTAYAGAWGRTRKEAERWAAHEALLALEDPDGGDA